MVIKMKKIFCGCLSLLMICMVSSCSKKLNKFSMTATDLGFDTVVTFTAYTRNEAEFTKYQDIVKTSFLQYDKLFDRYDSVEGIHNIKTINDMAGKEPVEVDQEIIELLKFSKTYDTITDNRFDITLGSLLDVWHTYRDQGILANSEGEDGAIPTMEELASAASHKGWEHVIINEEERTVYLDDPDMSLDVGGVAKGYTVEKIAQKLEEAGCEHAILNGGGNVRLLGDKPEADYWSVGIQIPDNENMTSDSLISIKMNSSSSFVTSGDYQRYYTAEGKLLHHIIDPQTLMPANYCRSVTIITPDSGIADILSTTLFTMSQREGMKLIETLREQDIDVDAVWVYDDKVPPEHEEESIQVGSYKIVISDGLNDRILQN